MRLERTLIRFLGCVQCSFIFRAQELDLGRLATAFALLRLPGMPELAHQRTLPTFTPSSVDPNTIKVMLYHSHVKDEMKDSSSCEAFPTMVGFVPNTMAGWLTRGTCCSLRTKPGKRNARKGLLPGRWRQRQAPPLPPWDYPQL